MKSSLSETSWGFSKIQEFSTPFNPRSSGRRRHDHHLRWLPVGGSPQGKFFTKFIKINDFNVKSSFSSVFNGLSPPATVKISTWFYQSPIKTRVLVTCPTTRCSVVTETTAEETIKDCKFVCKHSGCGHWSLLLLSPWSEGPWSQMPEEVLLWIRQNSGPGKMTSRQYLIK